MPQDRWLGLVLCLWILGCAGMASTFALYSPVIKAVGDFDQRQVDALAVAKDLGECLGIIPGLLCDFMPPWLLLVIGCGHFFFGFGTLWLFCSQVLPPPGFLQVFGVLLVASQGTAWFNTASLVICVRNFPKSRGTVVGLLKGMVGLSGAIYTQLYTSLLAPNQASFPGLLAILPPLIVLPSAAFVGHAPRSQYDNHEKETGNLKFLMISCFALATYLCSTNVLQEVIPWTHEGNLGTLLGIALVCLLTFRVPASYWKLPAQDTADTTGPAATATIHSTINAKKMANSRSHEIPRQADATLTAGAPETQRLLPRSESVDSILLDLSPTASQANLAFFGQQENPGTTPALLLEGGWAPQGAEAPGESSNAERGLKGARASISETETLTGKPDDQGSSSLEHRAVFKANSPLTRRRSSKVVLAVGEGAIRNSRRKGPRRGEDFKLSEAIWKADFWLLAFSFMCGCGSGVTAINNLAQMGAAQGYGNVRIFVSLISIWSFIGRLGGGYLSEELVRDHALPRPLLLLAAQSLMSAGHLCFAFAFRGSLHVGCIVIGLCYGVHWSVMPATVSELFGLQHFGVLFNVVATSMPLGSFLFSSLIAGSLYDYEAQKHPHGPTIRHLMGFIRGSRLASYGNLQPLECTGAHCFFLTFLCMFAVSILGALATTILVVRTRRVYTTLYGNQNPHASHSPIK